jgi:hypothetical protein
MARGEAKTGRRARFCAVATLTDDAEQSEERFMMLTLITYGETDTVERLLTRRQPAHALQCAASHFGAGRLALWPAHNHLLARTGGGTDTLQPSTCRFLRAVCGSALVAARGSSLQPRVPKAPQWERLMRHLSTRFSGSAFASRGVPARCSGLWQASRLVNILAAVVNWAAQHGMYRRMGCASYRQAGVGIWQGGKALAGRRAPCTRCSVLPQKSPRLVRRGIKSCPKDFVGHVHGRRCGLTPLIGAAACYARS